MSANSVSEESSLTSVEADQLVGQTITRVVATEFGLILTFSSGAVLEITGHTYSDCALGVELSQAVRV
jgi:hypothetical protein